LIGGRGRADGDAFDERQDLWWREARTYASAALLGFDRGKPTAVILSFFPASLATINLVAPMKERFPKLSPRLTGRSLLLPLFSW
jgi:hypothetical protein